jgi:hypothetical protein
MVPVVIKNYNSTKLPKHGMCPIDLLYGEGTSANHQNFSMLPSNQVHPMIGNEYHLVMEKHKVIKDNLQDIKDILKKDREQRIEKKNVNKRNKDFKIDQLVLIHNFSKPLGVSRTLRPFYNPSPYRVIQTATVSLIAQRITDNLIIKIHFDDAKSFNTPCEEFEVLPNELKTVMMKNFQQLTEKEIAHFVNNDTFDIPETAIAFPKQLTKENIHNVTEELIDPLIDIDLEPEAPNEFETDDVNMPQTFEDDHYELDNIKNSLRQQPNKVVRFPNIQHNTQTYD